MPCSASARNSTGRMASTSTAWTKGLRLYRSTRAVVREIDVGGRTVTAVAPCPEDIIVSKLARLDDKDKSFIEAYHSERPLDPSVIEERIRLSGFEPSLAQRACAYIRSLTRKIAD